MSTTTTDKPAIIPPANSTQLVELQQSFARLDEFAKNNCLESIIGDEAPYTTQLRLATAMNQLRQMLTPEVMAPIMELQGSALGFRTDKDKEGGYKVDVVREVLIEAQMKGFRMFANETNIIGGRFYATREGFERIFRDLSKSGRITNLRLLPSVPKTSGDGATVDYSASWTVRKGDGPAINDELKLSIPVRVNSGQGPDAILGKAKRKMLAAIYSRITGTEITDGEVDDPRTIDVSASKPVEQKAPSDLPADLVEKLEAKLKPHEELANRYLVGNGSIKEGQTFRNVTEAMANKILKQLASFLTAIGVK